MSQKSSKVLIGSVDSYPIEDQNFEKKGDHLPRRACCYSNFSIEKKEEASMSQYWGIGSKIPSQLLD